MPDREESEERTVCPAPMERRERLEREVWPVFRVFLAPRERLESLDTMEDREKKETADPRVPSERARVNQDPVVSWDWTECPDPRD